MTQKIAPPPEVKSRSVQIFMSASEDIKKVIKEILAEERNVQHLQRRSEIHSKIYNHIRRIIK